MRCHRWPVGPWLPDVRGDSPCVAVEGATTGAVFEVYVERTLAPSLRAEQVVMDNLSSHKGRRVREVSEGLGRERVYRPTRRASIPSNGPSRSSRPRCGGRGRGPSG